MTCRDEVLACANNIVQRKGKNEFSLGEILAYMKSTGTKYKESTIRTHVTARMCSNAPKHHASKYHDFERISHGLYRLTSQEDSLNIPAFSEIEKGYHEYQAREKRDAMYKIATFLIQYFWGNSSKMADSLGVLLYTWNQAFYRYGLLDFEKLEWCITRNQSSLENFRQRTILSYSIVDNKEIELLFGEFLSALQISDGKNAGRKSPVSASKALHLLAPSFFPLWDYEIARIYGCNYASNPEKKFIIFMGKMRSIASYLDPIVDAQKIGKTLLKLIDEYNYSKYTKGWI